MKWAILYRYHEVNPAVVNHLEHVRRSNPYMPVYGLFGGPDGSDYSLPVGMLDDTWAASGRDPRWHWQQSDLSILDWYRQRGHGLPWDRIVTMHWDCLVLGSFRDTLPGIGDQTFIHGLRPLDPRSEMAWFWTSPKQEANRKIFDWFRIQAWDQFRHAGPVYWANVCITSLARDAMNRLAEATERIAEAGDDEYRMPTLAKILGLSLYPPDALGDPVERYPLNCSRAEVPDWYIDDEMEKPAGRRVFHPVYRTITR